jgi:hypothetical protein
MQFDIWDTAGQERFRALGTLFWFKYLGTFFMIWVFFWFLIVFGILGFKYKFCYFLFCVY